jgi:hypothetical protein
VTGASFDSLREVGGFSHPPHPSTRLHAMHARAAVDPMPPLV